MDSGIVLVFQWDAVVSAPGLPSDARSVWYARVRFSAWPSVRRERRSL